MKGIAFVRPSDLRFGDEHPVAGHRLGGGASVAMAGPADFILWSAIVTLEPGAELRCDDGRDEEALYVVNGTVVVGESPCPASGAIVLESKSAASVRAVEAATLVNFGSRQATSGRRPTGRVHVVGPRGVYTVDEEGRDTHWYSDEECDGCAMSLHYSGRRDPWVTEPHSHSQSEILYVVSGKMRFGSHLVPAGSTVAVEADRRYAFRSSDDAGLAFVNYRAAASFYTADRSKPPIPESPILQDFVRVVDR